MTLPELYASSDIKNRLVQGHPWIYRNQINGGDQLRSGTWVRLRCGNFHAIGLWDATSPIAVRLFTRHSIPDSAWFRERVWEAWETREKIRAEDTNAYRWIYGEGDGLPGIVVDRYGAYAVIQTYAPSLMTLIPHITPALRACDPDLRGIVLRQANAVTEAPPLEAPTHLHLLWGELPPEDLVIQENTLYFQANLYRGQKTGLFLDQRENRRMIQTLAAGHYVLNCFAYTGGFSLYALRGAAMYVVSVDSGQGLAEAAATNIRLNQLEAQRHDFVTDDCFAVLDRYAKSERRFTMIILDPPSFARTKSDGYAALRAYTRLNTLALRCIEPGGLLISASCTSQIAPAQFQAMLADAANHAKRRLVVIHEAGQPSDHPIPAGFPEGRYLKCIIGRVMTIP